MLEHLALQGVGPAPRLDIDLAPRLNLVTGDNGVGKTFLLDVAWWALTRTWANYPALPRPESVRAAEPATGVPPDTAPADEAPAIDASAGPTIAYRFGGKSGSSVASSSHYDFLAQEWPTKPGRPGNPGLVLYAQVDGSFAVWDPARNYWKDAPSLGVSSPDRPPTYLFDPEEVWNGLTENGKRFCNGLIADWAFWQNGRNEPFVQLCEALVALSPSSDELLQPGGFTRISLDDSRPMPTIKTPYGLEVPVVHASAGVKRILALAYLLVWSWQEHVAASQLLNLPPTKQIIFLIDEIEAHLHPRWQRTILRSLLDVVAGLAGRESVGVQVLAVTHSPLLLASLEPLFDGEQDALWHVELVDDEVKLREEHWQRRGDANAWLQSDVFDLGEARSLEAERAMRRAEELMRRGTVTAQEFGQCREALLRLLPDVDPFLVRWRYWAHKTGLGA